MPNTSNYMNSSNLEHIIDNYLTININLLAFSYFNNSSSLQYDPTTREIVKNINEPSFNNFTNNYNLYKNISKPRTVITGITCGLPRKHNINQYMINLFPTSTVHESLSLNQLI